MIDRYAVPATLLINAVSKEEAIRRLQEVTTDIDFPEIFVTGDAGRVLTVEQWRKEA